MRPVGFTKLFGFALAIAAVLGVSSTQAAPVQNKAVVRGVSGTANYSTDKGANWKKLNVGTSLTQGSVIRTAPGARVDLFLNQNGPVVRVTEDTTMALDKLTFERMGNEENIVETQLDLRNGRILGHVKKLAAASKYEVKTPTGVAGIRGTQYDIRADGTVTVIEGQVVVVYIVDGRPSTATVNSGETAYPPSAPGEAPRVLPTPSETAVNIRREIEDAIRVVDLGGGRQVVVIPAITPVTDPQQGEPLENIETDFGTGQNQNNTDLD